MVISTGALLVGAIVSAVVGAGASVGAQALQNKSQRETNELNAQINADNNAFSAEQAEIARQFSSEEAQKERDWQTEMSNTAVQRKAADLEAAGFNRALAVTSPSASTPSGAAATGPGARASGFIPMQAMNYSPMAQMANNLSHLVNSANSIIYLQKIANNNPQAMATLAGASRAMNRSVTSANRVPSMKEIERDIASRGLDYSIGKYVR